MIKRGELVFRWVVLAAMCAVIFAFSSFPAETSSEQSSGAVDLVVEYFVYDFESYPAPKQEAVVSLLTVVVRKGAHFSEYALLSILAFGAFVGIRRYLPRWSLAVLFSFVYACTDELHQMFVPGRAGMWRDVFLDTTGAVVGGLFACFISMMIAARRVLRRNESLRSKD